MFSPDDWRENIMAIPVFDTHTHLNKPGVPVPAQNFWDIAHYFWFQQELWSVGYPKNAAELPEEARIAHFVKAFTASRNTAWNLIVRTIFKRLYDVDLSKPDADRIREADAAVRANAQNPKWARSVIDRLSIRRIVVNNLQDYEYPELPGVGVVVPTWAEQRAWTTRILEASDTRAAGEAARQAAKDTVAKLRAMGIRGMRVNAGPFEQSGKTAVHAPDMLPQQDITASEVEAFLSHAILHALSEQTSNNGQPMFAQFFLGIERDVTPHTAMAVNKSRCIINLYPLFERYACDFELVVGAPQNNMDAAQAARIYPNVHVGGLWWYNFRGSTYQYAMQVRLEAVPASKSALVATDARCIEWCYGKTLLVKWLLADFLYQQVTQGWVSQEDALWVAREWLHDAAARRYLG